MSTRGANLIAAALVRAGVKQIFSLSGNQIMPIYDACLDTGVRIIHVRHEAAAVHMADAVARLSAEPAVALVTAGPGHANAIAALYTARCSESPVLLLSGHAPNNAIGRGAFQEMAQVEMAATVCKEAWTASSVAALGHELARAFRVASSGRPGPVHLSLPFDLLNMPVAEIDPLVPDAEAFRPTPSPISLAQVDEILDLLESARQPLVLTGPAMFNADGGQACMALADRLDIPVVPMQSPRGLRDPALGAFHQRLPESDLVLLLGKPLDFTLNFGGPPGIAAAARVVHIDAEQACLERSRDNLSDGERLAGLYRAEPRAMLAALLAADRTAMGNRAWRESVEAAVRFRPSAWKQPLSSADHHGIHPADALNAVDTVLDEAVDPIFVCDGGEVGQWAQAVVRCKHRVINGPSGSIGGSLSFALGVKAVRPRATVIALMGDGTFGFHMGEIDTAVRNGLAVTCVIGNDACWNAEHQIQIRDYGADRTHSCELLPSRYDQVCVALGGHGECVTHHDAVKPALERAIASGRMSVVNVMTARIPAPDISML